MAITRPLFAGDDPTPASVKRRQLLAEQLLADNSGIQQISHPLQAVAQVLGAGVGSHLQRGADRDEASGLQARRDASLKIANGYLTGGTSSFGSSAMSSPQGGRTPAMPNRTASLPSGERASYIRQGLVNRGLPEHVADGFMHNFQDESGLDPGINEHNPIVPGSRGGFGLFQSTGPRRRALESVAAMRGLDPSDIDTQLDVLAAEMGLPGTGLEDQSWFGSEARAARSILGSRDTASAAQAIVNDFLRPSPEHRQSRSARYAGLGGGVQVASLDPREAMASALGAQPANVSPANQALGAALTGGSSSPSPMQPQAGAPAPDMSAMATQMTGGQQAQPAQGVNRALIAELLGNPWTEDMGQSLLMQGITQQQEAQALARQQAYDRAVLNEQRQYDAGLLQGERAYDDRVRQEGFQREDARNAYTDGRQVMRDNRADLESDRSFGLQQEQLTPTSVREYEYAVQGGYQGSFADYEQTQRRAGATNIVQNAGEGNKFYEKLDTDNAAVFSALSEEGVRGTSKLAQIDRLEGLLANSPSGGAAAIKLWLGERGINSEGLDSAQAAQALINELVPQQRQPGSGPMSDADLALFKQSLPRLINQPGANQTIISTMRGITQYQIQMGRIADAVADRALTPAQARDQIRNLANPLEGFRTPAERQPADTTPRDGGVPVGGQAPVMSGMGGAASPGAMPIATNPETGEMIQWNGREWVPMQ